MSKRFTETEIWDEDWFIDTPKEYKLFWFYLKDQCNHAGIWRPNLRIFEAINEVKIDLKKAIQYFNTDKERIAILKSGHWYIIDFFVFQYGTTFNISNRVHESIEVIYNKEDIKLTSIRGLKDLKDRVKDKDKDKDIDIEEKPEIFDFKKSLLSLGVEEAIIKDWLKVRNKKKGANTETAFNAIKKQIELSGVSANECIKKAVEKSWCGFEADWIKNNKQGTNRNDLLPTDPRLQSDIDDWKLRRND